MADVSNVLLELKNKSTAAEKYTRQFVLLCGEYKERIAAAKHPSLCLIHYTTRWFRSFLAFKDEIMVLIQGAVHRKYLEAEHKDFKHDRNADSKTGCESRFYSNFRFLSSCSTDGIKYLTFHSKKFKGLNALLDENDALANKLYALDKKIDSEFSDAINYVLKDIVHAKHIRIALSPYRGEALQAKWLAPNEQEQAINMSRASTSIEKHRYKALSTVIEDPISDESICADGDGAEKAAAVNHLQLAPAYRKAILVDDDEDDVRNATGHMLGGSTAVAVAATDDWSLDSLKRSLGASETLLSNYEDLKRRKRDLNELKELIDDVATFDNSSALSNGNEFVSSGQVDSGPSRLGSDLSNQAGVSLSKAVGSHRVIRIPILILEIDKLTSIIDSNPVERPSKLCLDIPCMVTGSIDNSMFLVVSSSIVFDSILQSDLLPVSEEGSSSLLLPVAAKIGIDGAKAGFGQQQQQQQQQQLGRLKDRVYYRGDLISIPFAYSHASSAKNLLEHATSLTSSSDAINLIGVSGLEIYSCYKTASDDAVAYAPSANNLLSKIDCYIRFYSQLQQSNWGQILQKCGKDNNTFIVYALSKALDQIRFAQLDSVGGLGLTLHSKVDIGCFVESEIHELNSIAGLIASALVSTRIRCEQRSLREFVRELPADNQHCESKRLMIDFSCRNISAEVISTVLTSIYRLKEEDSHGQGCSSNMLAPLNVTLNLSCCKLTAETLSKCSQSISECKTFTYKTNSNIIVDTIELTRNQYACMTARQPEDTNALTQFLCALWNMFTDIRHVDLSYCALSDSEAIDLAKSISIALEANVHSPARRLHSLRLKPFAAPWKLSTKEAIFAQLCDFIDLDRVFLNN